MNEMVITSLIISYIKRFRYLAIALLVILVLGISPSFFIFNNQKASIEGAVKRVTGYNLEILGDVTILLLPLPKIILNSNKATNHNGNSFEINKIVLGTNFGSLFSFIYTSDPDDLAITKLAIQDAEFSLNKIRDNFSEAASTKNFKLSGVELSNVSIILDEDSPQPVRVGSINAKFQYGGLAFNDLKLVANFNVSGDTFYLDGSFSSINDKGASDSVAINFYGAGLNFKFDGRLADLFNKPQIDGNVNFSTKLGSNEIINSPLLNRLAKDTINAAGNLVFNESLITLTNFKLASNSVSNFTADFQLAYKPENEVDFSFSADKIDLDNFLELVNKEATPEQAAIKLTILDYLELVFKPILSNFNFNNFPSLYGGLSGRIDKIIINKREINNIAFSADVLEGDYFINNMKMSTPGMGELSFKGKVSHNDIRPELSGQLLYKVDDFNDFASWIDYQVKEGTANTKLYLSSDFNLIPRNLKMSNIRFASGDAMLTGRLHLKDKGTKYIDTSVSFRVNNIDLNKLGIPEKVDDIVTYMYVYDADKIGYSFSRYVNDYRALRTFPIDLSMELLADKVLYKDQTFEKVHTSFRVSANDFNIDQLEIEHELLNMEAVFGMQLTAFKPDIKLQLNAKKIDGRIYSLLFPSTENLKAVYADLVAKSSEPSPTQTSAPTTHQPSEQHLNYDIFNFFSANSFNADLNINIDEFIISDTKFNKILVKGMLNEGVFKFDKFAIGAFNGLFEAVGNMVIVTQVPTLSISYAYNNFNPKQLLDYFFGYKNLDGYMSISGVASAIGVNMRSMLMQTRSDMTVIGKKITMEGLDLSEIIKATEAIGTLNEKTERIRYFAANGNTVFDDVSGKVKITGGIADLNNFVLGNNRMRGSYVGKADFINGLFNANARLAFIPAGVNATLTLDLTSSGSLKAPKFQPNTTNLIQYLRSKLGGEEQQKIEDEKNRSLLRNRRL